MYPVLLHGWHPLCARTGTNILVTGSGELTALQLNDDDEDDDDDDNVECQ